MDLFFQLLLGAVSGYYTNIFALGRLFSNNGIIARNKDNFIDEVSKMVSEKIINYNSIFNEMKKDKFKNNIKEFFKRIKNSLINKTFIKIKDINGFQKSKENTVNFIRTSANDSMYLILKTLSNNITLSKILDEKQARYIIRSAVDYLSSYISNGDIIVNIVNKSYNNEKYKSILKDVIDNILNQAKNNINNNEENIKKETINLIELLIKSSDLKRSFIENLYSISNTKVKDLFSFKDNNEIRCIINILIENEEFKNIINDVIEELYIKFKDTDKTLYELLNPNIANRIRIVLSDILPDFIDTIIPIIQENKNRLDKIIEDAVDEEIENIDNFLMQIIVKVVRNVFLQDVSAKYKIVKKIINYIEEYKNNNDDIVKAITDDIMNYLNNTKISVILKSFNNINDIKSIISDIIIFNIKEIPDSLIERLLNTKLNIIMDYNIIENLYDYLEKEIINYVKLNLAEIIEKVRKLLYKRIDSIDYKLIEKLLKNINIKHLIEKNRTKIEDYIYNIYDQYKDNTIYSLLNNIDSIVELIFNLFEELLNKYSNLNLNTFIISKEKQIDTFIENNAYNSIINFIEKEKNFISNIIDSFVIKTIKNNMGKLNKDEIADMANDFMGKELEPINIIGMVLGAVLGVASSLCFPIESIGNFNYLAEPVMYALIGVLTNFLAIYSIFQPYEPLFGIKQKVFWGAVACEKGRFAVSMSEFVNDRLMEREGILGIIDNKDEIENSLVKDNYKTFFNYMLDDERINNFNIFRAVKNNFKSNIDEIKSNIINKLADEDYVYNFLSREDNKNNIISYIDDNFDKVYTSSIKYGIENINPIELKKFFQNLLKENLKDLNKFRDVIVNSIIKIINADSIRNKIFDIVSDLFDNEISKKIGRPIKELFGGEIVNIIKNNNEFIFSMINEKLMEYLNNNKDNIRETVMENVPIKNNFVESLIDKIIVNIINRKLPIFIYDIKSDIVNTSYNFLDNNILSKDIAYLFGNEKLYDPSRLKKYLNNVIDTNQKLIHKVVDNIFVLSVNKIDYSIIEKYADNILDNTDEYAYKLIRDVLINIYNDSSNLSISIKCYIDKLLYPFCIKEYLDIGEYFNDFLIASKYYINEFLIYLSTKDFIDLDDFIKSVDELLLTLENNKDINELIYIEFSKILSKLRNDLPNIIDDDMKNYIFNLIINVSKDDINLIIDAIDFSGITKKEIDDMNPKNIHDIFNSFAKEYLNRLILYGSFGGLVGVLLLGIKFINTFSADISNILNIMLIIAAVIFSIRMAVSILKNISN